MRRAYPGLASAEDITTKRPLHRTVILSNESFAFRKIVREGLHPVPGQIRKEDAHQSHCMTRRTLPEDARPEPKPLRTLPSASKTPGRGRREDLRSEEGGRKKGRHLHGACDAPN